MPATPVKPKIGRPRIKAGEESAIVNFRAPSNDVEEWRDAAKGEGITLSLWIRRACEKETRREKKR